MEEKKEKTGTTFLSDAEELLKGYGREAGEFVKYTFRKVYGTYMDTEVSMDTILFMKDGEVYVHLVFDEDLSTCLKYRDYHPVEVIDAISRALCLERSKEAYRHENEEYKRKLIKIVRGMVPIRYISVDSICNGRRGCISDIVDKGFGVEIEWIDEDNPMYEPEDRIRLSDLTTGDLQQIIQQAE